MLECIFEILLKNIVFISVVSKDTEILSYLFVTAAISDVGFVLFMLLWGDLTYLSYVEAKEHVLVVSWISCW